MIHYSYAKMGEALIKTIPECLPLYEAHRTNYHGDILPHPLFGDFTRFVISVFQQSKTNPDYVSLFTKCLNFIEELMNSGDEKVVELAEVSFLENLHQAGADFEAMKEQLGPHSKQALARQLPTDSA